MAKPWPATFQPKKMEAKMATEDAHEFMLNLVADQATRMAILAAGGTIEPKEYYGAEYHHVVLPMESLLEERILYGDGPMRYVGLCKLIDGQWIKVAPANRESLDQIGQIALCDLDEEIQLWTDRRERLRRAGVHIRPDWAVGLAPHPDFPDPRGTIPGVRPACLES
ncbi:MAG: hypothetical protein Q8P30_03955 [Candidatus Uhrbacteria bacterium]|nr:hypothetical protein [Candidatus Uhrbacteria bacterium]